MGRRKGGRNTRQSRGTQTTGTQTGRVMKKVGKRGAYKKNVKNQMVMRRGPIVETKQRVHSDIAIINGHTDDNINPLVWRTLLPDDAFSILNLESYYRNQQGLQEYEVIGNNIFSKYLNLKTQFRFPKGEEITLTDNMGVAYQAKNAMIQDSCRLYLICGWVTTPPNFPLDNQPSPSLPAQSTATQDDFRAYLIQQLKPFFDDDEDKLQFRPKQTTNIKVEYYRRIKPNLNEAIGTQAVPAFAQFSAVPNPGPAPTWHAESHGSIPDVMRSHSWKTMKKIALTKGADQPQNTNPVDKENLFPNTNSWIPFGIIYNMDYEQQQAAASNLTDPYAPPSQDNPPLPDGRFSKIQYIQYRYNDAHYFTDS